jgi:uncharacterized protein (DUF2132 family)
MILIKNPKQMHDSGKQDPLHGITLKMVMTRLLELYGWDGLSKEIDINCFKNDPSVSSSLKFLRKTPWARKKVEDLYLRANNHVEQIWSSKPKTNEA